MKYALITVLFVTAPAFAQPSDHGLEEAMETRCQNEWPSDYRMQEYCLERQKDGLEEFRKLSHDNRAPAETRDEIGAQCLYEWSTGNAEAASNLDFESLDIDWSMAAYCYDNQLSSYDRLH